MKKRVPASRKSAAPLRLGLVGAGNMGSAHARSILAGAVPGCTLAAVCDLDRTRLAGYGEARVFTDARAMFASGAVEAVLIATPHPSHVTLGIAALRAGLHLLMEKPLGIHKGEVERLLAEPRRGVLAVMFNQRTDPRYIKIRELVRSGALGTLQRFAWTVTDWFRTNAYYRSSPWRATWAGEGGGMLLNQGVHHVDLLQWIFGMPVRVRARASFGRFHPIDVEDEVCAMLEYAHGLTGVFTTSSGEAPGVNRLEVAGDRGLLILDGDDLIFRRNEESTSVFIATSGSGYDRPAFWDIRVPLSPGHGPQHEGILRNFVAAIRGEEPLVAPGPEGLASVELINAILLAAKEDCTVRLPLHTERYARLLGKLQRTGRKPRT